MAACPTCGNGIDRRVTFCPYCGTRVATAALSEEFKIVTALFCDVVKSTELGRRLEDVPMRRVMDRYGEIVRGVLTGHGASVGRRHGDGFMAAFGIPELHEDDALRAVRAAGELRAALRELDAELQRERGLSLKVRIGINTGTVLVRDAGALEDEVTGEAVTVAKRFEEAAGADQVLLGAETYRLVADAVRAEQAESIAVAGVPEPQDAWRLLEVLRDRPARVRRLDAPLIGRDLERQLLLRLLDRVEAERSCHLVTVLGFAGVGKSRLVDEFVGGLGRRAAVLRGNCLAYGDSTALWPMVQIVRQAAGVAPTDPPDRVHERLRLLVGGEDRGELIAQRVAQVLGAAAAADLPEDTVWALRRLLETLAGRHPLVVVVDDLHWAEPILLDTLEHVVDAARDSPIMLVCMARPDELFPRREHWPDGKVNAFSFLLSPLSESEGEQLVGHLLGGPVDPAAQAHITEWAQGFPLLVEELVANLRDEHKLRSVDGLWELDLEGDDGERSQPGEAARQEADRRARIPVPTSIQALLLARLERLDDAGQAIVERAAVVGEQFHVRDVDVLAPTMTPDEVAVGLEELVRLDLVRLDHSPAAVPLPPGSGAGYRFRHMMVRTVAYDRIPDDRRAELHERYADWLERNTEDRRSQFDELVAYHLYEAYRYASGLQPGSERTLELARRTGERHAAAGYRAAIRGDNRLAVTWLGRAARLLPASHPGRLDVLRPLAEAYQATGQLTDAIEVYDEIASAAAATGDQGLGAHATIGRLTVAAQNDPERFLAAGQGEIQRAVPVFERLQDRLGLAKAWYLLAYRNWARGRLTVARSDAEKARRFAKAAGDQQWESRIVGLHGLILYWGPTPLAEVEQHSREALDFARGTRTRALEAEALTVLARVAAMRGRFDEARQLVRSAKAITADLGLLTQWADVISEALIDLLDGKLAAAEQTLRRGESELERTGGIGPRADVVGMLARVLLLRGQLDAAEELTTVCEGIASAHQLDPQIKWRAIRAVVLARRGEVEEAEALARRAVDLADESDQVVSRAEAREDLAEVLSWSGRHGEAGQELELAIWLFKEKGSEVAERNALRKLGRLRR